MIRNPFKACLALLFVFAVVGCATEIKNTVVGTREALPLKVSGLLIVYEPDQFTLSKGPNPQAQQAKIGSILAMFQDALAKLAPTRMAKAGIPALYAVGYGPQAAPSGSTSYSHIMYVVPLRDQQVCNGSSCSHRLTIQLRLVRANSTLTLWSTEVEEPYVNSALVYQARYDELAENVAKAILLAVRSSEG